MFSTGYPLFHIHCGKLCGKHCGKKFSTKSAKVFHRLSAGNPSIHQCSHISTMHNNNIYIIIYIILILYDCGKLKNFSTYKFFSHFTIISIYKN